AKDDVPCIFGLGITTGTSATTYSPADFVTREQMASFLARMYRELTGEECSGGAHPFTDMSATSFAKDDVPCIFGLGVTTGTSATTYSPADFVTREQMASFLARVWRTEAVLA
ncbi:MAG: S-layer homology domain-containing protein, partial [Acidimicrobiaceae bacterium]|nr:S-layer homology domain-containing protein [Acidimicrobiaceae bacterium]